MVSRDGTGDGGQERGLGVLYWMGECDGRFVQEAALSRKKSGVWKAVGTGLGTMAVDGIGFSERHSKFRWIRYATWQVIM